MNVRFALVTIAAAVLTVASFAVAQVPTPGVPAVLTTPSIAMAQVPRPSLPVAPVVASAGLQAPLAPQMATTPQPPATVTPVIASADLRAPVARQMATTPQPTAKVVAAIASADLSAPVAMASPAASLGPVPARVAMPTPAASLSPVAARLAPVAAVGSVSALGAAGIPQAPSAQSPKVVATTPPPTPNVVRPAMGATPKVTLTTVGEDQQTPPQPPAPPVPPQAPTFPGGVRGGARTLQEVVPSQAPRRAVRGQLVNLRLEFTITDQIGSAAPVKKTVTMNVADGESGRIRTNADVFRKAGASGSFTSVPLSIDASPEVEGTKIRLRASLEYQLLNDAASADVPGGKTSITQNVTSILNDGIQTVLSQSADPLTDRRVTLEVKATIVK